VTSYRNSCIYQYENYFRNLNQLDEQKKEWLDWARKKADWYDPFIEMNDEVMERIDRDKLEPTPLKDGGGNSCFLR